MLKPQGPQTPRLLVVHPPFRKPCYGPGFTKNSIGPCTSLGRPRVVRYIQYNFTPMTCDRSVVFSGYSCFLHHH